MTYPKALTTFYILMAALLAHPPAYAGFDWGDTCAPGTGSFSQEIANKARAKVGLIPAGKANVVVNLTSPVDVDIQLVDTNTGTKIVDWQGGFLAGGGASCGTFGGLKYCYSGYNGNGTGLGNEYIKITGTSNRPVTMYAYGYAPGAATVDYSWAAPENCVDKGKGSFEQNMIKGALALVGTLPAGKENVQVALKAQSDLDIEIYHGDKVIVAWNCRAKSPHFADCIDSYKTASVVYEGMTISYSGYNGDGTGLGNEFIKIDGKLTQPLTVKAYAYQAGTAKVSYQWGPEKSTVNVMTWNMACRDFSPYAGCDNCDTRMAHIADAIDGKVGYEGLPNFDDLDVIVGQELFTDTATFQKITDALKRKGFTHVTAPMPDASSPQCGTPIQLGAKLAGVKKGDNGGLVMWSRYPVKSFKSRLWCAHAFPTYQGYTTALLEVEGRNVVMFNMHMMPEISELQSEDIRMYQFSEIVNLAKDIDTKLSATGAAYSIIVGGDYNEDAYSMNHTGAFSDCNKITDTDVKTKFHALNFDLDDSCQKGAIGASTWDPTVNDLAAKFSSSGKHEVLDYLIEYAHSGAFADTLNVVHNLRYTSGWTGQFCNDAFQGEISGTTSGTVRSLSDHNAVVARFALPAMNASTPNVTTVFNTAFDQFAVQTAACGQADAACVVDSNCCRSPEYAFDGHGYQCNMGTCERAKLEGESCSWISQGSECGWYNEYGTGKGLHCDTSFGSSSGKCVEKYTAGSSCVFDHECDSGECSVTFSWGIPTGKKCE
jgi:hypothetical protein